MFVSFVYLLKEPAFSFINLYYCFWASLVAQRLKHLPGMWETWVRSLGQKDPLEKEMATHSSTLAWRIPWREEPGRLQSMGSQRVGHNWVTSLTSLTIVSFISFSFISAQISMISFLLLICCCCSSSSFPSCFRCKVRLSALSFLFLEVGLYCYKLSS